MSIWSVNLLYENILQSLIHVSLISQYISMEIGAFGNGGMQLERMLERKLVWRKYYPRSWPRADLGPLFRCPCRPFITWKTLVFHVHWELLSKLYVPSILTPKMYNILFISFLPMCLIDASPLLFFLVLSHHLPPLVGLGHPAWCGKAKGEGSIIPNLT